MRKKGLIIFNKTFCVAADPSAYADYGPFMPGFVTVPYNNLAALEEQLKVSAKQHAILTSYSVRSLIMWRKLNVLFGFILSDTPSGFLCDNIPRFIKAY
jgi:hypothetical protein